ncbi:MAG: linear amide C-N hydrolase [Adlercreutzia sp.]
MCTGVRFADAAGNLYFGRNLDWCESYGEGVVITPRGASIPTQFLGSLSPEHACVGMGIVGRRAVLLRLRQRGGGSPSPA